jgi:hypothetical protein
MSTPFRRDDHDDGFDRTVREQRMRALQRLDGQATAALGKHFSSACADGNGAYVTTLASMIARDLAAIGLSVTAYTTNDVPGGVWLAPAPDRPAVIVTWTQHEASAMALGPRMHAEVQRQMNLIVFEILHLLGYALERHGPCGAHIITRPRAPINGHDFPME